MLWLFLVLTVPAALLWLAALVATVRMTRAITLSPLALGLPGVSPRWTAVPGAGEIALVAAASLQAHGARRPALLAPLGLLAVSFMLVRAGAIGWRRGGIEWRGVLYRSEVLRGVQRFRM